MIGHIAEHFNLELYSQHGGLSNDEVINAGHSNASKEVFHDKIPSFSSILALTSISHPVLINFPSL